MPREYEMHKTHTQVHDNGSMQYSVLKSIRAKVFQCIKRPLRSKEKKKGAVLCSSFHSEPLSVISTASQLLLSVINEAEAGVWMATLSAWR